MSLNKLSPNMKLIMNYINNKKTYFQLFNDGKLIIKTKPPCGSITVKDMYKDLQIGKQNLRMYLRELEERGHIETIKYKNEKEVLL